MITTKVKKAKKIQNEKISESVNFILNTINTDTILPLEKIFREKVNRTIKYSEIKDSLTTRGIVIKHSTSLIKKLKYVLNLWHVTLIDDYIRTDNSRFKPSIVKHINPIGYKLQTKTFNHSLRR
jgi:hypothetical protein